MQWTVTPFKGAQDGVLCSEDLSMGLGSRSKMRSIVIMIMMGFRFKHQGTRRKVRPRFTCYPIYTNLRRRLALKAELGHHLWVRRTAFVRCPHQMRQSHRMELFSKTHCFPARSRIGSVVKIENRSPAPLKQPRCSVHMDGVQNLKTGLARPLYHLSKCQQARP